MLVVAFSAQVAEAQSSRRVVVIHPPAADDIRTEAVTRVQGELTAAGFDVVHVLEKEGTDVLLAVDAAMKEMQPLAVFAIFAPPPSASGEATAQILFSDGAKGRTLIERMPLDRQHPDHEAKVLAVRAVELLKANLAEFWVEADRVGAPPVALPVVPKAESAPPPALRAPLAGFGVEAGLGVIQQFHELGASVMPVLKLSLAGRPARDRRATFSGWSGLGVDRGRHLRHRARGAGVWRS